MPAQDQPDEILTGNDQSCQKTIKHNAFHVFLLCMGLGYWFGILFGATASGGGLTYGVFLVLHPAHLLISIIPIALMTVVTYPMFYAALSDRSLYLPSLIVVTIVSVEIIVVAPIHGGVGFFGTLPAYYVAVWVSRQWTEPICVYRYACHQCGHNFVNLNDARQCPECGWEIPAGFDGEPDAPEKQLSLSRRRVIKKTQTPR